MSPFGPFYCVFRWDLSQLENSEPKTSDQVQVRYAKENEFPAIAELWHNGLSSEDGTPWADYLRRWTPNGAAKWFLDSRKRLDARMIVAEKNQKIVGLSGFLLEKRSAIGRMYTGIIVAPEERRHGIGSILLYRTLLESKREGLRYAEVETIQGITASRHLYPKFGGKERIVSS